MLGLPIKLRSLWTRCGTSAKPEFPRRRWRHGISRWFHGFFCIQMGLDWIMLVEPIHHLQKISWRWDWMIGPVTWPPIQVRFGWCNYPPAIKPHRLAATVLNHPTLLQKLQTLACFGWPQQSSNVPTVCDSSHWPIESRRFWLSMENWCFDFVSSFKTSKEWWCNLTKTYLEDGRRP